MTGRPPICYNIYESIGAGKISAKCYQTITTPLTMSFEPVPPPLIYFVVHGGCLTSCLSRHSRYLAGVHSFLTQSKNCCERFSPHFSLSRLAACHGVIRHLQAGAEHLAPASGTDTVTGLEFGCGSVAVLGAGSAEEERPDCAEEIQRVNNSDIYKSIIPRCHISLVQ